MSATLINELREHALREGLDALGVCEAAPFPEVEATMRRRVASGTVGRLGFTFTRPEVSCSPRATFAWAERLVVGGRAYLPGAGDPGRATPGSGRVARFAVDDAYAPLRRSLASLADRIRRAGFRASVLVDDKRLVDRAAAVRAGIGWWGRNTMVLAPGHGPWLLLGSVVTDALLPVSAPMRRDCGTCQACLPACPTGALTSPGVLDATRCLAYWAQTSGVIPAEFRAAMGDRLYGCDDCVEACPPGSRLRERARETRRGRVDLVRLLATDDRTLLDRFAHFYVPHRQARYLRRNALVALGNSQDGRFVPVLAGFLSHPDWLLRLHAAWALGRVPTAGARAALRTRSSEEPHPEVKAEIEAALGSS